MSSTGAKNASSNSVNLLLSIILDELASRASKGMASQPGLPDGHVMLNSLLLREAVAGNEGLTYISSRLMVCSMMRDDGNGQHEDSMPKRYFAHLILCHFDSSCVNSSSYISTAGVNRNDSWTPCPVWVDLLCITWRCLMI